MFERRPASGRWIRCIIRSPRRSATSTDPASLRSRAYDLVLDGHEIGGGSIRSTARMSCGGASTVVGIGPSEEAHERFGFLIDALGYGAPPHGGIAMGLDRIVAQSARAPRRSAM